MTVTLTLILAAACASKNVRYPDTTDASCEATVIDDNASLEEVAALCAEGCPVSVTGGMQFGSGVESLAPLTCLTSVGGGIRIVDTSLTSLSGLDALESVGGLVIEDNSALVDLTGLGALTTITGNLTIGGYDHDTDGSEFYGNDALVTLDGLEALRSVGGSLEVEGNPVLESMAAMQGVAVAEDLTIRFNGALTTPPDLSGTTSLVSDGTSINIMRNGLTQLPQLPSLTSTSGAILIYGNDGLTDFSGFSALESVGDELWVEMNGGLTDLSGLDSLTEVAGSVALIGNTSLTSVTGLGGLVSVGSVNINNPELVSLSGLSALETVTGDFYLSDNDALTSLSGLDALAYVGGTLDIDSHDTLVDVDALFGLGEVAGDVAVTGNPALSTADAWAMVESIGVVGGAVTVEGNAP